MKIHKLILLSHLPYFLLFLSISTLLEINGQILSIVDSHGSNTTKFQAYIVHVQKPKGTKFLTFGDRRNWYMSFLPNTTLDSGEPRMIYTYRHAISGFAAVLTSDELEAMEAKDGFLIAYPEQECRLRTTYSPQFLGLDPWGGMWPDSSYGQGQIIGMIDTGIKYNHPSFHDQCMSPPPTTWNGKCYWKKNGCNNKLIGAVGFHNGLLVTPNDTNGHGTHTASTAAGNFVQDANVLGNAMGTASGLAPGAHLAVYKVLPGTTKDGLKGIDEAIRNHVDVLSMSLGTSPPKPFHQDPIAIGSFAAITKGIVPCQAGGNDGPLPNMVDGAPWILTVGSSTTDRRITAIVKLGDGREFYGESAYHPNNLNQLPLVYPYAILKTQASKVCNRHTLKSINITGKIVLCGSSSAYTQNLLYGELVKKAGGAGVIIMSQPSLGNRTDADAHVLPASHVTFNDTVEILNYVNQSSNPTAAIIFENTRIGARPAPTVSSFSNRGPNLLNGNIIKPDVIAPGSNILGAWATEVGLNRTGTNKTFIIVSGTSMATPHVSGIVALLKHNHPDWSPAAIKSAIMTTAYTQDRDGNPIKDQHDGKNAGVFTMGSGHVDPIAANEPGLIYDIGPRDYIRYLCGMKLTDDQVNAIVRGPVINCSHVHAIDAEQLNYPSISVYLGPSSGTKTISRTVTNVGDANSVYCVKFDNPKGVNVDVHPNTLVFSQRDEKKIFCVTFSIQGIPPKAGAISEGQLSWDSGKYLVRSPIAVTFN